MFDVSKLASIKVGLASPDRIREWSHGEVTKPVQNFYSAEEYHQDYLDKNPTGYCHLPESLFEFARKAKAANQREQS